jgi:hypothetical protein
MKVIIAGGREITDPAAIAAAMEMADLFGIVPTEVVSGKARRRHPRGRLGQSTRHSDQAISSPLA